MTSISTSSQAKYRKHKKARRLLQEAAYLGIRVDHPEGWVGVMHLLWPERIPRVVWAHLSPDERQQWRHYRELGRLQRLLDAYPVTNAHHAVSRLNRLGEITGAIHAGAVDALVELLHRQVQVGRLTLCYQAFGIVGPSSSAPAQLITREDITDEASWQAFEPTLRRGLALGLTYGGSVIVRQPVHLQAADSTPASRWRKSGIGLIEGGQWRHLDAQEMAQADGPDMQEAGVSYGTLAPPATPSAKVLPFPAARRSAQ